MHIPLNHLNLRIIDRQNIKVVSAHYAISMEIEERTRHGYVYICFKIYFLYPPKQGLADEFEKTHSMSSHI